MYFVQTYTIWLIIGIVAKILMFNLCHAKSSLSTVGDLLPDDPKIYDKTKPPKEEDQPAIVYLHVTVMKLNSIDEKSMAILNHNKPHFKLIYFIKYLQYNVFLSQTFDADIFFSQIWNDFRLKLPENMTQDYRLIEVEWLKYLWQPDSFFKNAKSASFQTISIPNKNLWLYKDKSLLYMIKLKLKVSCAMDFVVFPHDTQECRLQIESLSYTTDDVVYQWDPDVPVIVHNKNIKLPKLQLVENRIGDCTQIYAREMLNSFSCLEIIFVLKRRLGYHLINTYIPSCMIVIISWVAFWMKPILIPARITLGVLSFLALELQHLRSLSYLPPVSYFKAIDLFMTVCSIFVFFSLMEYVLVRFVLDEGLIAQTPPLKPSVVENIFSSSSSRRKVLTAQERTLRALSIDKFSRVFFPFLFAILNATYWIVFSKYM